MVLSLIQSRAGCPKGYIRRKGYTRKFKNTTKNLGYTRKTKSGEVIIVHPTKGEIQVASTCIKDRGLPGKGPREGEGIGELRRGALTKYGYYYALPTSQRESSLKRAIKAYGALSVYRKLDAIAKLSMRVAPDLSKVYKRDRDWVYTIYKKEQNLRMTKKRRS